MNSEIMLDWLRDAYAMERGMEVTLRKQMDNDDLPQSVRTAAASHLNETERHAAGLKACLEARGADTSAIKTGMSRLMEAAKAFGAGLAHDESVKFVLTAYTSEHFEIACYKALRAGALETGQADIAELCDRILPDEERMADWLDAELATVVAAYLRQEALTV